ncbi:hypothetical protein LX87_05218 [Larkinella arboricola]|uniref:Uncharacterized protein n=1 Tax=Larkinella arboricola TaxID=643671 RepID=A0A327WU21_LARAB|nr:hypothetical protein LX87_05218 [Larkinella arboricola]
MGWQEAGILTEHRFVIGFLWMLTYGFSQEEGLAGHRGNYGMVNEIRLVLELL